MDPKKTQRLDEHSLAQINQRDRALRALDYVPARLTRVLAAQEGAGDEIKLELTISRRALLALIGADVVPSPPSLPAQAPQPVASDQRRTAMMTPHDLELARSASLEPEPKPELDAETTTSISPELLLAMGVNLGPPKPSAPSVHEREHHQTIDIKALAFGRVSKLQGEDQ